MTTIREVDEVAFRQMVDAMHKAYGHACEVNETTPEDFKFFREYVFTVICMMIAQSNEAGVRVEPTIQ